jgi:Ca-activated chloride channel family protein
VSFDRPWWLLALVVVPVAVLVWRALEHRRQAEGERFASAALLPALVQRAPGRLRLIPAVLLLLGLCALLVGMAKPHAKLTVQRHDATVVLEIDVSRSMGAKDVPPSRLFAAVAQANQFLNEIPTRYSVALVAFGSNAYVTVPPTTDRNLVRQELAQLRTGEGTAIGDAVLLGAKLGKKQKVVDGVVPPTTELVISDGARDGGKVPPLVAAKKAKALGVPVNTVLVGTPDGIVTAKLTGGYTEQIRVPADPTTLRAMAQTSGGTFYRAATPQELAAVYKKLATRLGHTTEDRQVTDIFAGGGALLLLVGSALSFLWFRRFVP